MTLEFCSHCGTSIGKTHAWHRKDGSVVCHDCQHLDNVAKIEARRHRRPVATIVFVVLILGVAGYFGARQFTAREAEAGALEAGDRSPPEAPSGSYSVQVADAAKRRLDADPQLARDEAIAAALVELKENGKVPSDFDDELLRAAASEQLRTFHGR
jgi:hypothetical protein